MTHPHYERRLSRVTTYLHDHLDDKLDLNRLAEVACLSPAHWHRVYQAVHGESIVSTVRRVRLHRAAGQLANTPMSIERIATLAGYSSVAAFSRVFADDYGMPPARYRQQGLHTRFQTQHVDYDPALHNVDIRELPAIRAYGVEHRGSYMQIGRAFEVLYGWLGANQLFEPGLRSLAMYRDDPTAGPEDELSSCACVVLSRAVDPPAGIVPTEIPGGQYAVLRHRGPYASMRAAYDWLFGEWLPGSDYEAIDAPVVEEYLNNPRDTAPPDLLTDLCLPVRKLVTDTLPDTSADASAAT